METRTIALIGAGGKMGCRIADNLRKGSHRIRCVEIGERGVARLAERGLAATAQDEAVAGADIVILAVPDVAIGRISAGVVPQMRSGAMLIVLDPAAAYLDQLPKRDDVTYFVTHPATRRSSTTRRRGKPSAICSAAWRRNKRLSAR